MSAFHRCQHCGCVTDVSSLLPAFEENPHCRQCGLSVSEVDAKMQDDLAALMARNLHLSAVPPDTNMSAPPTPQVVPQPAPITYISTHYHHSAHLAAAPEIQASTILEREGINAAALLPSQIQLFKKAQPDQQQRLIELWRISPPTYGNQLPSGHHGNWPQTSMDQEEMAARERWEKQEQERLKNLTMLPSQGYGSHAEPYMQSGYRKLPGVDSVQAPLEYKQATDPAYQSSREWWNTEERGPMEHQYGMIQQMMQYQNTHASRMDADQEML